MKHLVLLIVLSVLAGCASTRKASTTRTTVDETYRNTRILDSLFRVMLQRDSIYTRDSIYVIEKGDTVTKYVEHTKYVDRWRADTEHRDKQLQDTLYINRTDTITILKPVYIEKPIRWYDKAFMWAGKLCCLAAILWAVFLYIKRKF